MGALRLTYQPDETTANLRIGHKKGCPGLCSQKTKTSDLLGLDYYPFGSIMPGRSYSSNSYKFGFNGQEKDDEITGVTGSHMTAMFWEYDSRIGRRWNLDPVPQIGISDYACFAGNPILFSDPLGNVAGDYYKKDGTYLGSDGLDDDKVYTADAMKTSKDADGNEINEFTNASELSIKHSEFAISANIIKHESSGNLDESLWTAHAANNAKDEKDVQGKHDNVYEQLIYGKYSTVKDEVKTTQLSTTNSTSTANNARAAMIDVLSGGLDPTGGAVLWDGDDFLKKGLSHNKYKEYTSVNIKATHLQKYALGPKRKGQSIGGTFWTELVFDTDYSETGKGKYYSLHSTGAPGRGRSIFWKIEPK